ncbi:DUF155-domain-containing protein [Saitoella complicata NRRL Y-17804]|uniref:DUF155-domain-containing protein n=1 Tax=Saitoella complicata (strain BCRC 22490 / CBS 7301 / JCM 7358 / NBRC 10748 / NRRL Y-17804) TaxID=698492 RepID=UPI000867549F|nr:DUF155-domain-containing protein [Saitoella complicata NRRL Y-17804]ODQ53666.1 DUF155-domain-containing protein [Saitoella complicata NRRL Y-17804]
MSAIVGKRKPNQPNNLQLLPSSLGSAPAAAFKAGPQRTTKTTQKLTLLPEENVRDARETESGRDVYSQLTQITDTTARRDAERLGKAERAKLPRVTAYCTASGYRMDDLVKFLQSRKDTCHTLPKKFDECVYSTYSYTGRDSSQPRTGDLLGLSEFSEAQEGYNHPSLPIYSEVFLFDYGVTVIWGMTEQEERRFLKDIGKFEIEKLGADDVEIEEFNYYVAGYQSRIYNDFITLKDGRNYMVKLSISHAIAQSVKISLFEELVDNTIEVTKDIPQDIAESGKVAMSRKDIMKSVGELFILRININLQGSVLDSPELFWAEPQLEPIYQAARSYLEINQRVSLLNQRVEVISDLLSMLKEQLTHSHGEWLEWIVIILIAAEIVIAVINIIIDIFAAG